LALSAAIAAVLAAMTPARWLVEVVTVALLPVVAIVVTTVRSIGCPFGPAE
jgi:hypothetical protein